MRSGPEGNERDLEAALVALIEVALSGWERSGPPSEEQAKALARALAGAVREVIRAPLREALQAGYELGLRAARETPPGQAAPAAPLAPPAPTEMSLPRLVPCPALPCRLPRPTAGVLPRCHRPRQSHARRPA